MRRRDLSDDELTTVIILKRAGSSWVKVQRETGINRRTAKRAYDKWQRSKTIAELKEARKDVAAQAFREHMDSLVTLATFFVMNLEVPRLPELMDKNAEQFFTSLLEQDLLQRGTYISTLETKEAYPPFVVRPVVDSQAYRREKELLFESLNVHTRENARLWKAWDEWKEARDNCKRVLDKLRKETSKVVNNFLNQETNLLRSIKKESGEDNPVKRMAEVVLREIWRAILRDKLAEEGPWFQTVARRMAHPQDIDIHVKSRDERVLTLIGDTNMSLAEKVTHICNLAANNLRREKMVESLKDEVRNMEKASDELRDMLNPVKLRPMILRTRCDLCPV